MQDQCEMLHPTFFLMPYVKQFYLSKTGLHAYIFGQRFSYEINYFLLISIIKTCLALWHRSKQGYKILQDLGFIK